MRRALALLAVVALVVPVAASAEPVIPETGFTGVHLAPRPCAAEPGNVYEEAQYLDEGWTRGADGQIVRYPGACQRLRFAFGPIHVKPGQNDVLIEPITIQKPAYDGYVTRMRPDLVYADGNIPGIDVVHLHHGTWIQLSSFARGQQIGPIDTRVYGSGPFFASGEEKTIGDFPRGYGFPVKGTDHWDLLYMVHSSVPQPQEVFIIYDVDYVAKNAGDALGLKEIYPIWLDVRPSSYPVFNTQRPVNAAADLIPEAACQWPAQNCAMHDPWGRVSDNQGKPVSKTGSYWKVPTGGSLGRMSNFTGGTLVGLGGHLHPGGLTTEVDLVSTDCTHPDAAGCASTRAQRIFTSEAWYWDRSDPTQVTPRSDYKVSWDFSMTVTGLPRWAVNIRPGQYLRINATYDNSVMASYENMGIVVAYITPFKDGQPTVAGALNPLDASFDPATDWARDEIDNADCLSAGKLCDRGLPTHGHMKEVENFGGTNVVPITKALGPKASRVDIAGFVYAPGDLGTINLTGIPTVAKGGRLTFVNEDMAANIYHTITACKYPCSGKTGTAYPIPDGASDTGKLIDFDSAELGYSPDFGAAKNSIIWDLDVTEANGFDVGTYTYFCRVHPFMRGAFAVTES